MRKSAKDPMTGVYPEGGGHQNPDATDMKPSRHRRQAYTPPDGNQRRGVGKGGKL